jgi:hypothetical protein
MQHREIVTRKLELIEGRMTRMESLLSRGGSANEFKVEIQVSKEMIQDVKDYIQREPRTSGEK